MLISAVVVLIAFGAVGQLEDPVASYPRLMGFIALASAGWLGALWQLRRRALRFVPVLAVSVLVRLALLLPEVPLSDDLYRYLWDGKVANAGVNPFLHAPSAEELSGLRDEAVWPHINHPSIPTIYPPTAQMLFRILDLVAPTPLGARACAALFDLSAFVLLACILRRCGKPPAFALAHGWCPLAVLESAGGGHIDAAGASILLAGFLLLSERRSRSSVAWRAVSAGVFFGLSAMVKPLAILLAPGILRDRTRRNRALLLLGGAIAALLVVPYLDAGGRLFTGFLSYAEHWRFNDLLYSHLADLGFSARGARLILAVMLLVAALACAFRIRDPLASGGCVIGAFLFLSPTVHPWYALWLVPFLPFLPRAFVPAGVTLVTLLPLSYAAAWLELETGAWAEPSWSRTAVWAPTSLALVAGVLQEMRGGKDLKGALRRESPS